MVLSVNKIITTFHFLLLISAAFCFNPLMTISKVLGRLHSMSPISPKLEPLLNTVRVSASMIQTIVTGNGGDIRWVDLKIEAAELRVDYTLMMGQCFNWKKLEPSSSLVESPVCWVGVLGEVPFVIRSSATSTYAACLDTSILDSQLDHDLQIRSMMKSYFQTDCQLSTLYELWSSGCSRMKQVLACLPGVRVVRQDPFECLISFICSSNNNIKRITLMLDRLRYKYGRYLCSVRQGGDGSWAVTVEESSAVRELVSAALSVVPLSPFAGGQSPASDIVSPRHSVDKISSHKQLPSQFLSPIAMSSTPEKRTGNSSSSNGDVEVVPVHHLFAFPTVEALAAAEESDLRALGE